MSAIRHIVRLFRKTGKDADALGLEALIPTFSAIPREFVSFSLTASAGDTKGLFQIDARRALCSETGVRVGPIVGVEATVAIERHTPGQSVVDVPAGADLRQVKGLGVVAIEFLGLASLHERCIAARPEYLDAEGQRVGDCRQSSRIGRDRE